jgi:2-polyprenyl-3-methyl-5-hydroxy-6-metoxy-1,4-benzoquinol methylase
MTRSEATLPAAPLQSNDGAPARASAGALQGVLGKEKIAEQLKAIADRYPPELVTAQQTDVRRITYNIGLVTDRVGRDVRVCDVGGGIGLFSVGCAALGMRSTLVDDFRDNVNYEFNDVPERVHKAYGVQVVSCDVIESPPEFADGAFDVVTSFDSMEHWHHSPKGLFHRVLKWLRPGGLFVLGVPNCVNLRKRLTVPLGIGKWSSMGDWYEQTRFRQHVREPDVGDLRYIARDLGLQQIEILGRNWLGYTSRHAWVRLGTPLLDVPLCLFPSLCADIYLVGRTPG